MGARKQRSDAAQRGGSAASAPAAATTLTAAGKKLSTVKLKTSTARLKPIPAAERDQLLTQCSALGRRLGIAMGLSRASAAVDGSLSADEGELLLTGSPGSSQQFSSSSAVECCWYILEAIEAADTKKIFVNDPRKFQNYTAMVTNPVWLDRLRSGILNGCGLTDGGAALRQSTIHGLSADADNIISAAAFVHYIRVMFGNFYTYNGYQPEAALWVYTAKLEVLFESHVDRLDLLHLHSDFCPHDDTASVDVSNNDGIQESFSMLAEVHARDLDRLYFGLRKRELVRTVLPGVLKCFENAVAQSASGGAAASANSTVNTTTTGANQQQQQTTFHDLHKVTRRALHRFLLQENERSLKESGKRVTAASGNVGDRGKKTTAQKAKESAARQRANRRTPTGEPQSGVNISGNVQGDIPMVVVGGTVGVSVNKRVSPIPGAPLVTAGLNPSTPFAGVNVAQAQPPNGATPVPTNVVRKLEVQDSDEDDDDEQLWHAVSAAKQQPTSTAPNAFAVEEPPAAPVQPNAIMRTNRHYYKDPPATGTGQSAATAADGTAGQPGNPEGTSPRVLPLGAADLKPMFHAMDSSDDEDYSDEEGESYVSGDDDYADETTHGEGAPLIDGPHDGVVGISPQRADDEEEDDDAFFHTVNAPGTTTVGAPLQHSVGVLGHRKRLRDDDGGANQVQPPPAGVAAATTAVQSRSESEDGEWDEATPVQQEE